MGVTRLSLGVENFKPEILQYNGRAHLEEEIYRAYGWARDLGFPQINIDLIAGMVGEDWDNWQECVRKTIDLAPDSVTIYQMELPYNTVFSKELKVLGNDEPSLAVADWPTKRAWVEYAFDELEKAGYDVSSATTVVKDKAKTRFVYRDALWHGADMFGTGVASFGHVNGVHVQNVDTWEEYVEKLNRGELPLGRAFPTTPARPADPRDGPATEDGPPGRGATSATSSAWTSATSSATAFDKLQDDGWLTRRPARASTDAGRADADRPPPADVLRPAVQEHAVHVTVSHLG